jgi:glycopeptide antibiotics resistance protein
MDDRPKTILVKVWPTTVLALYLAILIWLILFKLSLDLAAVLQRSATTLTLIPFSTSFQDSLSSGLREVVYNIVAFIPFGLLIKVNFKHLGQWRKLGLIVAFSLLMETAQYALAIGAADITDVITNTLGGWLGLKLYDLGSRYGDQSKLDRLILLVGAILLIAFMLLRTFIFRFSYHSAH